MINELDGLAKGSRSGQYESSDHAAMVQSAAFETVRTLEREFAHHNQHLRALTSKGTVMTTIAYRSEEEAEGVNYH